jgi:hypothetical protein
MHARAHQWQDDPLIEPNAVKAAGAHERAQMLCYAVVLSATPIS